MKGTLPLILSIVLLSSGLSLYAQTEKVIIAEGIAAGGDLKARDEAINRALRRAVEQAVGVLIDSESMTQNYQLLEDRIYSDVKGYVKSYKIIEDNRGEGDIYRIKVEAVVRTGRLDKDIKALNIIKEKKQNPRIMILGEEFIDGIHQPTDIVCTELERLFLEKNFPIVDKSQFFQIKQLNVSDSYTHPEKAATLGREYGAEIVIVVQATSNLLESSRPYGVAVYGYTADTTAKAIKTDTARIFATISERTVERGSGRIPTANKALKTCAGKLGDQLIRSITEKWRSEVFNTIDVTLVIFDVKSDQRPALKEEISKLRGIKGVYERSYLNGVMTLDLTIDSAIWPRIEEYLAKVGEFRLKLVAKTPNRIECYLEYGETP